MAGTKINDNVTRNKKVSYFNNIRDQFSKFAPSEVLEEYYLIDWDNLNLWDRHYEGQIKDLGGLKNTVTSGEKFRDYCYKQAEKDARNNFVDCNGSYGWCENCPRNKNWAK